MEYILFMMIYSWNGNISIQTQEFNSLKSCKLAKSTILNSKFIKSISTLSNSRTPKSSIFCKEK